MRNLIIQETNRYYCYVGEARYASHDLNSVLEQPLHQDSATVVHLRIENGSRLCAEVNDFFLLMETIAKMPQLQEFSIAITSSQRLPAQAIIRLLKLASKLESLTISDANLEGSIYEVAEVLQSHKGLRKVELKRCHCRPVHVLVKAFSSMKQLKEVTLDGVCIGQQRDVDGYSALKSLCQSKSMETLVLKDLMEEGITRQILTMMEALQHNNTLKQLSLDAEGKDVLPSGVIQAVARMIQRNRCLEVLLVSWMGEMVLPIVEALRYNQSLKEFRFTKFTYQDRRKLSNQFLNRACAVLKDHNNTVLEYLLQDTEQHPPEVAMYLTLNTAGRAYLLKHPNSNHTKWIQAITDHRDNPNVTFYLLSHNPSLLISNAFTQSAQPMVQVTHNFN